MQITGAFAALSSISNVPNIHGEIGALNPQRYSRCFVIDQFDSFTAFTAVGTENPDTLHKLSGCVCVCVRGVFLYFTQNDANFFFPHVKN